MSGGARPFKPLVVGAPRSGFTLLISVLMQLRPYWPGERSDARTILLRHFVEHVGKHVSEAIIDAFAREGIRDGLLFNPNFRYLPGGPKWLDRDDPERACVRKYIGVRGMGDFTLVTSHPRALLEVDPVVHSHENPGLWLSHPGYADFTKFASVRHPLGILNSAVHSINALASEYIQKFVPPAQDDDTLREGLALYKYTDLNFYQGLVRWLASYLDEFLAHREGYACMRWEDLISMPAATIHAVARAGGIVLDDHQAQAVWAPLDHVNLTGHHKHNYRVGHGKVGDWAFSMTRTHVAIAREWGLERQARALGYEAFPDLAERAYTPFQQRVAECLRENRVYRDFPDRDLFTFAFNKSNLISDKFAFQRYGWREHTQVERSIFSDEAMLFRIWDAAERAVGEINAFLADFLTEPWLEHAASLRAVDGLAAKHRALGARLTEAAREAKSLIEQHCIKSVVSYQVADNGAMSETAGQTPVGELELQFIRDPDQMEDVLHQLVRLGRRRVRLSGVAGEIQAFLQRPGVRASGARLFAAAELAAALGNGVEAVEADARCDADFLFEPDGERLSSMLMSYIDRDDAVVVAPITSRHSRNQPLFLISIPKAGTHLLHQLVEAFGFGAGIQLGDTAQPGNWYCLEYSNSHTVARDFFVDTVRRSPFGNRHHPFPCTPALFIYRHPWDILVSEANYYHRDGNTVFEGYFSGLSFEERLLRLIDDPWLLGNLRERIGGFIPWLSFPNVIPLSFEELIGPHGGGNLAAQRRLIWSLQLKLHVDGNARDFADMVFNRNAATFHAGQIGAHRGALTDAARSKLAALPDDYLAAYGYDARGDGCFSRRIDEFRRRALQLAPPRFDHTPIVVDYDYLGCNIVRYGGRWFGVPHSLGPIDLTQVDARQDSRLIVGASRAEVRQRIEAAALAQTSARTGQP